jgi:hypothetical protein
MHLFAKHSNPPKLFAKLNANHRMFGKLTHHTNHSLMNIGHFIKPVEREFNHNEHKHHHALEKAH